MEHALTSGNAPRCRLVAYRRVSTVKQGQSGLGLEAQDDAILTYSRTTGCEIVGSYLEVESSTNDLLEDRPELMKAIRHAKRSKATLVIARLDRLVRSTIAMAALRTSHVSFVACDNPHANEFTIDILVAMAAEEARKISQRTKVALAAYRTGRHVSKRLRELHNGAVPKDIAEATAGRLGAELPQCRNLTNEARQRGVRNAAQQHRERANEAYADLIPDLTQWRSEGLSMQAIADRLNSEGHTTRRQRHEILGNHKRHDGVPWERIPRSRPKFRLTRGRAMSPNRFTGLRTD
jgi:DNA invertase Pin-like site-specific DNA recombinase